MSCYIQIGDKTCHGGHYFKVKVKDGKNTWTFNSFQTVKLMDKYKPYLQLSRKFSKDENT